MKIPVILQFLHLDGWKVAEQTLARQVNQMEVIAPTELRIELARFDKIWPALREARARERFSIMPVPQPMALIFLDFVKVSIKAARARASA